ncbi:MAG: hypothetical protein FJW36_23250 [Acidobacteria bacterium]|nr:hypothetical protein [Acidobacteriota bacterium]
MKRYLILLTYCLVASAQSVLVNPGFEEPGEGGVPKGWKVVGESYQVTRVEMGCMIGPGCVEFTPGPKAAGQAGILEQTISARGLEELEVNWVIAVNAGPGARASLNVIARDGGGKDLGILKTAFNTQPLNWTWALTTVGTPIPKTAATLAFQILIAGGRATVDSTALLKEVNRPAAGGDAMSVLNRTALNNLMAFAKVFGVVRHFHPSDQAAEADWEALALDGVRRLDYATQPESLARRLNDVFAKVAPTMQAYVGEPPPLPEALQPAGKTSLVRWKHRGFGQKESNVYRSEREKKPAADWRAEDLYVVELPRGLRARVPLAVFQDLNGTLPRPKVAAPPAKQEEPVLYTGADRATRLAAAIIGWNISALLPVCR